ncbi:hypothetical protein G9A89_022749 [Geosiphon pyriformis]|nr:hypothetical protein G9A89_022749 [Geosiphon pyriformis]
MEETAILQPIGSSNKEKQPALAPRKYSNMWTPISLNITSNTPPINQIMAYQNIIKLEKFSGEKDNAYSWIADAEKAITTNGWNNDCTPGREAYLLYQNQFNIIKQKDHKAITTYFGQFNQILHQILAIKRDYYTMAQPELQKLTNHPNGEKITTTANTHSNSNNLGDLIPTTATTARNLDTSPISAKHSTLIFHTLESTAPIHTTSPIHSTTGWRNSNNNQVQTNSGPFRPIPCSPAQSRPTPTEYPNQASYLSLMEDQGFDKSTPQTKSNIPPATITEDTTLATIFLFDIDKLNTHSLFTLYTDARVGGIDIKLILNSESAGSIITKQLIDQLNHRVDHAATAQIITADGNTKTSIGEIDNFPFEINGIQIPTKHARVPAMCEHFKNQCTEEPLIEFEDTLMPPTIETYQVLWADDYRTELPPPSIWEEKEKNRAEEELQSSDYPEDDFFTDDPDAFQNQYQELASIHEEQEQRLADLNTKLCDHCLIPCHFQYCDKCDLMFNSPPRILFPITELPEPEEEVLITKDMSFQDSTEDTKTEQYLMYSDLSKELELK